MIKKFFHELKIGDVFHVSFFDQTTELCKIAEPIRGVRKSEQLPNTIVVDNGLKYTSKPLKEFLMKNPYAGHYLVLDYDEPVDLIKSIYDDKYAEDIYTNEVKRHNKRFVEIVNGYIKEADLESSVLKNFIEFLSDENF